MTTYRNSLWYQTKLVTYEYLCKYYVNSKLNIVLVGYSMINIDNHVTKLTIIFNYEHLMFIVNDIEKLSVYYHDIEYFELIHRFINEFFGLMF